MRAGMPALPALGAPGLTARGRLQIFLRDDALTLFDGQDFVGGRARYLLGRAAGPADFYQVYLRPLLKAEVEAQVVLRGVARAAADFVRLHEVARDDAHARADGVAVRLHADELY